jgi:hypothetical protein
MGKEAAYRQMSTWVLTALSHGHVNSHGHDKVGAALRSVVPPEDAAFFDQRERAMVRGLVDHAVVAARSKRHLTEIVEEVTGSLMALRAGRSVVPPAPAPTPETTDAENGKWRDLIAAMPVERQQRIADGTATLSSEREMVKVICQHCQRVTFAGYRAAPAPAGEPSEERTRYMRESQGVLDSPYAFQDTPQGRYARAIFEHFRGAYAVDRLTPSRDTRDKELPTLMSLVGSMPNLTGGLSSEDYVRKIRDEQERGRLDSERLDVAQELYAGLAPMSSLPFFGMLRLPEGLPAEVGVPRPTYANIERGRCKAKVDLIWRVAIVLDVPISSLLPEPVLAGPDTGGTT